MQDSGRAANAQCHAQNQAVQRFPSGGRHTVASPGLAMIGKVAAMGKDRQHNRKDSDPESLAVMCCRLTSRMSCRADADWNDDALLGTVCVAAKLPQVADKREN